MQKATTAKFAAKQYVEVLGKISKAKKLLEKNKKCQYLWHSSGDFFKDSKDLSV